MIDLFDLFFGLVIVLGKIEFCGNCKIIYIIKLLFKKKNLNSGIYCNLCFIVKC